MSDLFSGFSGMATMRSAEQIAQSALLALAASRKPRVEEISAAMRSLRCTTFECHEPLMKEAGCEELLQKRGQLFVHESENGPASGAPRAA
jgi:hypothetical protein